MKYFAAKELVEFIGIILTKISFKKRQHYDVAIIRIDGIGDYLIWHDCLTAYKNVFKDKNVLFICIDAVRSLAEQDDFYSEIISFSVKEIKKSPFYAFKLLNRLKRYSADILINPMRERQWYADLFALSIHSPVKKAIELSYKRNFFTSFYNKSYQELINCDDCFSEILANEKFTQLIINSDYVYGNNTLTIETKYSVCSSPYVVISFSSSMLGKNWPIERYVEIINYIPNNYTIVLTGAGKFDEEQSKIIEDCVNNKERIFNVVGKTTIAQLTALISTASFVIGNDSAAVHIAAAVRVPSIAIVSGADFNRFLPYPENKSIKYAPMVVAYKMSCYNCGYNCIYPDKIPFVCVNNVSVEMVKAKINLVI